MSYIFTRAGDHTITFRAGIFETSYTFPVVGVTLEQLRIITPPHKLSYAVGDEFDTSGIELMGLYSDGSMSPVDTYEISGFDSSSPTDCCTVTISCGDCCCMVDVEVLPILYLYWETEHGISLLYYYGHDQHVTIPSSIGGVPVTKIESTCFTNSDIVEVDIPETVTEIG